MKRNLCYLTLIFGLLGLIGTHVSAADMPSKRVLSTEIGNGGDLVQCHPDGWLFAYPFYNGWYMLDYAEFIADPGTYYRKETFIEVLQGIRQKLESHSLQLLKHFDQFVAQIPFLMVVTPADFDTGSISRQWLKVRRNTVIHDEGEIHISPSCRLGDNEQKIRRHQIVVREPKYSIEGKLVEVVYKYDERLLTRLYNKPLQLSMLIVHEWLWDYFYREESGKLRATNRVLHQENRFPKNLLDKNPEWL